MWGVWGVWGVWHEVGGGSLVLKTAGRWAVGLSNRCDVGLVGGGLSTLVGGWPPKQVGRKLSKYIFFEVTSKNS